MYECFEVTISDDIAHIKLSRPDSLNTMTPAFWDDLPRIVEDIDADAKARVIVVSSTGRHFTAGMDLSVFMGGAPGINSDAQEVARQRSYLWMLVQKLQDAFTSFERARMPVIAAIQGGCIGGGVDMVTAADMRYCTADAFFSVYEINIGMTADVGTLQRLPKLIPEGVAREMAYTGDRLHAERALEIGLVNKVFDDHDAMMEGVFEVAARIAGHSPLAIWGTKEMLNYSRDHSVEDGLKHIAGWQTGMFQPTDMLEEFSAKDAKRAPSFDGIPARPKSLGGA